MTFPLARGDTVRTLDYGAEYKVNRVGAAGFSLVGRVLMLSWSGRGKTWTSDDLDRKDSAKAAVRNAVKKTA